MYFYFFVIVLISVVVLVVVVYPELWLARKQRNWKFVGIVVVVLYLVGCADGVHDAAKLHTRNAISESRLLYFPLLAPGDYHYLYPDIRIKKIINDLHKQKFLPQVDNRPFSPREKVHFSKVIQQDTIFLTPDNVIESGDVLAFPANEYDQLPATCSWNSGDGWVDEQSQALETRLSDGKYWVLFISESGEDTSADIKEIRIEFSEPVDDKRIADLSLPTIWSR
ncbi:hypothetical protein LA52FAK_03590 [Desulforhopalus sp. 52FAK]